MSKQPALYPAEAPFRDLRGAICRGDGRAALGAIERALDLDALQYVGDGLLMALAQGIPDVTTRAEECVAALRRRDLDGDEDLTLELEAALGLVQPRALRDIPVDLDELSLALEGDPLLTGGRLDLRTGDVHQIGPLYEGDFDDEFGKPDDEQDGWLGDLDDGQEERRWLNFDSLGSRAGFCDMEEFLGTVMPEAILRDLGPSGLLAGGRLLEDLLAPAYSVIAAAAIRVAAGEDPVEPNGSQPPRRAALRRPVASPRGPSRAILERLVDAATVDCYDESEERTGLFEMIHEHLETPFATTVLGVAVTVTAIDLTDDDQIVAVCRRSGDVLMISLLDLPLPDPRPSGSEWVDAYRHWARPR